MNEAQQLVILNFEHSINELCKRKLKLLREVEEINLDIQFLREQMEKCYDGDDS